MKKNIHDYSDIINVKYQKSKNHMPMDKLTRASQFLPFAALSGYSEAIEEMGRLVEKRKELSLEEREELDLVLNYLRSNMNTEITVIYFVRDKKKDGGKYESKIGFLRRIDDTQSRLEFTDKTIIKIKDIYKIICFEYNKHIY